MLPHPRPDRLSVPGVGTGASLAQWVQASGDPGDILTNGSRHVLDRCSGWAPRSSPCARHDQGRARVPRLPHRVLRHGAVVRRHVDAELHASRVHRRPHRIGLPRRAVDLRAARADAAALTGRRSARRPLQPDALPDHHAGRADGRHRRACRARGHEQSAVGAVRRSRVERRRQRAQCTGIPGEHPVARRSRRPPRRDQPQLGGHQRQPGARSVARRGARRDRVLGRPGVPRQRRHVPVPHRRAAHRAHPRRARRSPRARLAAAAHRDQHRPPARGDQPVAAGDVPVLAVQPPVRRAVPIGRPAQLRALAERLDLQVAVRHVGSRRVHRRPRGRHVPRPHRPPAPRVDRVRDVRGEPRRVRARPLGGSGVPHRARRRASRTS